MPIAHGARGRMGRFVKACALALGEYLGYPTGKRIHVQGTCSRSVWADAGRTEAEL